MLAPIAHMNSPPEAADQHCYILKGLVAALAEVGGDGAGSVSCKRDHTSAPGRWGFTVKYPGLQWHNNGLTMSKETQHQPSSPNVLLF
jgi:hypothetical protein